jgi:hypothetical protein
MFHQTPSDTIGAEAGEEMGLHFEPQHGCQALSERSWLLNRGRNLALNWRWKNPKISW